MATLALKKPRPEVPQRKIADVATWSPDRRSVITLGHEGYRHSFYSLVEPVKTRQERAPREPEANPISRFKMKPKRSRR